MNRFQTQAVNLIWPDPVEQASRPFSCKSDRRPACRSGIEKTNGRDARSTSVKNSNAMNIKSDTVSIFTDIPFAQTPQRTLRLDLRVPQTGRRLPLVMYIPMGGMSVCVKEHAPWWLIEQGFSMASIEARVSSEAPAPAAVQDCKAAVRWLRAQADQYGYAPDAIGVWGHSAGGHLAALLGTSGDVADLEGDGGAVGVSSRVQAVCDECGVPHDLAWFGRPEVKARFPGVAGNLSRYLGGAVEDRSELVRRVSPQTYVTGNCPPMLLLHGSADDVVPVDEIINFHQVLKSAGVDATLRVLPGSGHGWDAALTRDDIVEFFTRTLKRQ